ncbi:MAG: delta-60 repeat domain-containing protein, partial [Bacteroidetes bacterium]|nr:delta-60 repeat domain-containing protein [Bacteroidota bacterium]
MGGSFTQVNGSPALALARINSDGTLNAFNTGLTAYGTVWSLQLVGNTLYVAGDYNEIGGISRSQLSAIDITT